MQNEENIRLLNLCVDESGTATVGISQLRYFLLTALVISPDQQELACLLFAKWRKKYLKNPHKSFHAADFFEEFEKDYRKPELQIAKNFASAVEELKYILHHVEFQAKVFYVDLLQLRKILGIENVPVWRSRKELKESATQEERDEYRKKRKSFEAYFEQTHSGNKDTPFIIPLLETFRFHQDLLNEYEKKDAYKRKYRGFISFESLSGADVKPIAAFHKYRDKINEKTDYGERIVGINFPTKNSLDGGIEIADLISYVSCQTLRSAHRLHDELKGIAEERLKLLKKLRMFMRTECKVELVDVTNNKLPKTKKANSR